MVEIAGRDRDAGANVVKGRFGEESIRARIDMPLQIAPDLVVVITQAVRFLWRGAGQQQPSRLNCTAGDNHFAAVDRALLGRTRAIGLYQGGPNCLPLRIGDYP